MAAFDESKQMDAVVINLVEEFPNVPEQQIRDEVQIIHDGFAGAKVRNFIPVLVGREAKDKLRVGSGS
jgi:hypothetical protein